MQRERIDSLEKAYSSVYQKYENQVKANSVLRTQLKDILARGEVANEARTARIEEESKLYE